MTGVPHGCDSSLLSCVPAARSIGHTIPDTNCSRQATYCGKLEKRTGSEIWETSGSLALPSDACLLDSVSNRAAGLLVTHAWLRRCVEKPVSSGLWGAFLLDCLP